MDPSGDLVGQHLTFASLECVKRRPRDFPRRTLRRVDIAGEVRVDEAGMNVETPARVALVAKPARRL